MVAKTSSARRAIWDHPRGGNQRNVRTERQVCSRIYSEVDPHRNSKHYLIHANIFTLTQEADGRNSGFRLEVGGRLCASSRHTTPSSGG